MSARETTTRTVTAQERTSARRMATRRSGARRRLGRWAWMAILPIALVLGYHAWASHAANPYFPTIPEIAAAFRDSWTGRGFTTNVLPSLSNLLRGYAIGMALGIAAGVALGRLPLLRRATSPVVSFLLTLPPVALLPLFLLVFGVGPQLQVSVIVFSVSVYVLVCTAEGVADIEPTLLDVSATFRVTGLRRLVSVLLPGALPAILSAARVALSLSILVMVVSEMVGASRGIGAATLLAQQSFAYDRMWAGMLLVAILGIGLNGLFAAGERTLLRRLGMNPGPSTIGGAPS